MHTTRIRPLLGAAATFALAAGGVLIGAPAANAAGVSGPAFWADGELYRTVGTPTDFSGTGAPADSFQPLYAFPEGTQANVTPAAPGDPGFRGGRWAITEVHLPDGYAAALASGDLDGDGVLDSATELWAAADAGDLVVGDITRYFECPVIPVPQNER
ncbi:hypothetical protein GCM10009819_17610 [Agromyces tropicus]|uniref:EF-hand domain-containing protein n=1 Tax=Agromyces tropicus TaxID=555371 RepID=A0ABN2UEF6_9MICO